MYIQDPSQYWPCVIH